MTRFLGACGLLLTALTLPCLAADPWAGGAVTIAWELLPPPLIGAGEEIQAVASANYDPGFPEGKQWKYQSATFTFVWQFLPDGQGSSTIDYPGWEQATGGSVPGRSSATAVFWSKSTATGDRSISVKAKMTGTIIDFGLDGHEGGGDDTACDVESESCTIEVSLTVDVCLKMPDVLCLHKGNAQQITATVTPRENVAFQVRDAAGNNTDKVTLGEVQMLDVPGRRTYWFFVNTHKLTFDPDGVNRPVRINGTIDGTVKAFTSVSVCGVDPIPVETVSEDYECNNDMVGHKAFDIEFTGTTLKVTLRILLLGEDPGEELRENWRTWIRECWGGWRRLKPDDCVCPGSQDCCKFPIEFDVQWVECEQHHTVTVHPGTPGGDEAMSETQWWTGLGARFVQHEVGHMLGLYDEYPEGATDPNSEQFRNVPCSLMHNGSSCTTRYPRHYESPYAGWLRSKTNRTFHAVQ